jgi:hypothetical protein
MPLLQAPPKPGAGLILSRNRPFRDGHHIGRSLVSACCPHLLVTGLDSQGGVVVRNSIWQDYLRNPREFDRWLKANAVLGSILAVGMLAMALAGHSSGRPDATAELSRVSVEMSAPAARIVAQTIQ